MAVNPARLAATLSIIAKSSELDRSLAAGIEDMNMPLPANKSLAVIGGTSVPAPRPAEAAATVEMIGQRLGKGLFVDIMQLLDDEEHAAKTGLVGAVIEHRAEIAQINAVTSGIRDKTHEMRRQFTLGSNSAGTDGDGEKVVVTPMDAGKVEDVLGNSQGSEQSSEQQKTASN